MFSSKIESWGPNRWIRERRLLSRMRASNAKYDAFVISVPKAGRTWHRLILGYYLARATGADPAEAMRLDDLAARAGIPLLKYTHNASSFTEKLPPSSPVIASPAEWQGKKVMLLTRDNRDVIVSSYFHCRFRERSFDGPISDFVRHPFVGIERVLTALNRWHDNRGLASSFEVVSYEALKQDPVRQLTHLLRFAGVREPDQALVEEALGFGSFDNLQRLEQSNYFKAKEMRNETNDPRASKIRSGKVGGYRDHLSADDLEFIVKMEREMGNPFAQTAPADAI